MNKVVVIIVNWNTGDYLARCIKSLGDIEDVELIEEVIVVDNSSSDRSIIKAKQVVGERINKPRVRFVQNDTNVGFAAANNIGIERVEQLEGKPHILLLNPDTEVRSGMIKSLIGLLDRNSRVGIVGPKLVNQDGTLQQSVRHFPTAREMVMYMLKLGVLVKQEDIDYQEEQLVDQVMGASFLIRNIAMAEVGKLDEGYFVWFEEVDYCRRAQEKGWEVWYTPQAECVHMGGVSFGQLVGLRKTVPWLRSLLKYASKHMSSGLVAVMYVLVPVSVLLSLPAALVHIFKKK